MLFAAPEANNSLPEPPKPVFTRSPEAVKDFFRDHIRADRPLRSLIDVKLLGGDVWNKPNNEAKRTRLIAEAKRVMNYELSIAATPHKYPFGAVDWSLNPTYNNYREWIYGVSRHGALTTLARYYVLTKDERAAKVWANMLSSFVNQCPVPRNSGFCATDNWRTIDTAIRVKGWMVQLAAFLDSPVVTDDFLENFFFSVYEHGWRLRHTYSVGNWLMIEFDALMRLGIAFPFIIESAEWKAYAERQMEYELNNQDYPDGFHWDLSTGYQGTVIESVIGAFRYYKRYGLEAPSFMRTRLEPLFEMYVKLMAPDGRTPALNDGHRASSAGWLHQALEVGIDRPDFTWVRTQRKEGKEPDYLSIVMPYSGSVAFRTSWAKDAVWGYFDGGAFGRGHQHEDKLNFLLMAYCKEMLIDPGNYNYDNSPMRKYVIGTEGHNTVMFDGLAQNRMKSFKWETEDIRKLSKELTFSTTPERDVAESVYDDGYGKNLVRFTHRRRVTFHKKLPGMKPFFVIDDRFTSPDAAPHTYETLWHLADCKLAITNGGFAADFGGGVRLAALVSDAQATIKDCRGQKKPFQGWYPIFAAGDHEHKPIPTPIVKGTFTGTHRVVTVLYPYLEGDLVPTAVKASNSCAADDATLIFERKLP